jgi:hypothetical protein
VDIVDISWKFFLSPTHVGRQSESSDPDNPPMTISARNQADAFEATNLPDGEPTGAAGQACSPENCKLSSFQIAVLI